MLTGRQCSYTSHGGYTDLCNWLPHVVQRDVISFQPAKQEGPGEDLYILTGCMFININVPILLEYATIEQGWLHTIKTISNRRSSVKTKYVNLWKLSIWQKRKTLGLGTAHLVELVPGSGTQTTWVRFWSGDHTHMLSPQFKSVAIIKAQEAQKDIYIKYLFLNTKMYWKLPVHNMYHIATIKCLTYWLL